MMRLMHQRFWPQFTPEYTALALSGAYPVQPVAACPAGTKKPINITTPATAPLQKESMFRVGKAISLAPIISGIRKFPKLPTRIGMTTKKIMIVACMVKSIL